MIIFNLQLKRRDGQYFIVVQPFKNIGVAAISEDVIVAVVSQNFVVTQNSEILSWHKIIAPCPTPSTPSPRQGPTCTVAIATYNLIFTLTWQSRGSSHYAMTRRPPNITTTISYMNSLS